MQVWWGFAEWSQFEQKHQAIIPTTWNMLLGFFLFFFSAWLLWLFCQRIKGTVCVFNIFRWDWFSTVMIRMIAFNSLIQLSMSPRWQDLILLNFSFLFGISRVVTLSLKLCGWEEVLLKTPTELYIVNWRGSGRRDCSKGGGVSRLPDSLSIPTWRELIKSTLTGYVQRVQVGV